MPQDLIGCWNQRKLKALHRQWREGFAVFFIVLWSYGRKISLNVCYGYSENSEGCSYFLRICFICGTSESVSQSWIPLQVADRKQGAFWFTNKRVQIKILSILKLVSFESLAGNDFSQWGTQAEACCKRNLQLWNLEQSVFVTLFFIVFIGQLRMQF